MLSGDEMISLGRLSDRPKTVAFVSSAAELTALETTEIGDEGTFVALTPEADWALEQSGLKYVTIEDLYDEDVLLSRGAENGERAAAFAEIFDRIAADVLGDQVADSGFSARHHLYNLKVLFDGLFHRSFTLGCALDELGPTRIVLVGPPAFKPGAGFEFPRLALSGIVLRRLATTRMIEVVELPAVAIERRSSRELLSRWRRRARQLAAFRQRRTTDGSGRASGSRVLIVSLAPGTELIEECRARGVGVVRLDEISGGLRNHRFERGLRDLCAEILRRVLTDPEVADLFVFSGADLRPIAEGQLDYLARRLLPRELAVTQKAEELLAAENISAVVSTFPGATPESVAVFVAAGRLGIPTIAIQHGGFDGYYDFPMLEHIDLNLASTYFCFGEGVAQYARLLLERSKSPHRMKLLPVGSSSLDAVRRRVVVPTHKPERKVVYVLAGLAGDSRYFSWHQYPDIWHWRAEREVVDACAATPGVRLFVKLHPSPHPSSPLEAWISARYGDRVQIIRDGTFLDAIDDADLVVIDAPTTTLLEALVADKPLVVYGDERFMHPNRGALASLEEAVLYAHDRPAFLAQLQAALAGDVRPPGPRSTVFLQEYATAENDGCSARRAVDALLGLGSQDD